MGCFALGAGHKVRDQHSLTFLVADLDLGAYAPRCCIRAEFLLFVGFQGGEGGYIKHSCQENQERAATNTPPPTACVQGTGVQATACCVRHTDEWKEREEEVVAGAVILHDQVPFFLEVLFSINFSADWACPCILELVETVTSLTAGGLKS